MKSYLKTFTTALAVKQFAKVAVIGAVNTVTFFAAFNVLRQFTPVSRFWAVALSFAFATLTSYYMNRWWTFDIRKGRLNISETFSFFVVNTLAWAATEGTMRLADAWFGPLSRIGENVALLFAAGIVVLPKFAGYRDVVFRKSLHSKQAAESPSPTPR